MQTHCYLILGLSHRGLLQRGHTVGRSPFSRGSHSCPHRQRQPSSLTMPISVSLFFIVTPIEYLPIVYTICIDCQLLLVYTICILDRRHGHERETAEGISNSGKEQAE